MVKATSLIAAAVMTCGAPAWAQDPSSQPPPQTAAPSKAIARPAIDPRRDDIRTMEMLFTRALQTGAQDLARQLQVNEPYSSFVTGAGRARGFALEGYGLLFDIDVPNMRYTVLMSLQMMRLQQERDKWVQTLGSGRLDDAARKIAESQLRQTERLMQLAAGGAVLMPNPNPTANTQIVNGAADRTVVATTVNESVATNFTSPVAAAAAPPSVVGQLPPIAPAPQVRDPDELYTESVQNALIEAMLKHTAFLKIPDNEWLIVAASDGDGPRPSQLDDVRIIIRIKGSDLAAFQSGKLTREEVMKRVEVREF